MKSDFIFMW